MLLYGTSVIVSSSRNGLEDEWSMRVIAVALLWDYNYSLVRHVSACHDIDQWPPPVPGETLNLPFMGTVVQVNTEALFKLRLTQLIYPHVCMF